MISWKRVTAIGYFFFSLLVIYMMSVFDHEYMVGEGALTNICIAFENLVYDDTRDILAPVTFTLIIPFIHLSLRRKFKSLFYSLLLIFLLTFWIWRFFLRFSLCF